MQRTTSLTKPVGSMMRPLPRVWASASVAAAATEIRESGLPAVGVTEGFLYVAIVTQESLAEALAQGVSPDDPVERAYDSHTPILPPYAPGERALDVFARASVSAIPIVDDYGRLMGVLTPADLYPKRDRAPRPASVGGMATPFGVYLTTGTIRAGAGDLALVTTGMVMFSVLTGLMMASGYLELFAKQNHWGFYSQGHHWGPAPYVFGDLAYILFLLSFRLLPLSGIHAAEHKVVHAIEKGEELTKDNVRRMPRVHPRCGTNLAVGASLFVALGTWDLIPDPEIRLLGALVATLIFWRPIGSFVQQWFTTKEPNDKQLDMGIRSGEELLKKYSTGQGGRTSFFWRIWNTGLIHVMTGAALVFGFVMLIQYLFDLKLPLGG